MHVYVYICAPIFFNETINKKTKKDYFMQSERTGIETETGL